MEYHSGLPYKRLDNNPTRSEKAALSAGETKAAIPNSAMISMLNQTDSPPDRTLDGRMLNRMKAFYNNQDTGAEKEADKIAASVNPTASLGDVRQQLGQRLNADFSDVRFHTDSSAAGISDSMGADAFAQGKDIYFSSDGYNATTAAHELVHTVQQGMVAGSGVSETTAPGSIQMSPKSFIKKLFGKNKAPRKTHDTYDALGISSLGTISMPDDPNAHSFDAAPKVPNGKFDSIFHDMDMDTKVTELQKLSQYLNTKRLLSEDQTLEGNDLDLQQTYDSVMKQSSNSDEFLDQLMARTKTGAKNVSAAYSKYIDDHSNITGKTSEENEAIYKRENLEAYKNIGLGDDAMQFETYLNMMNHASSLMDPGGRRTNFDHKRDYKKEALHVDGPDRAYESTVNDGYSSLLHARNPIMENAIKDYKTQRRQDIVDKYRMPEKMPSYEELPAPDSRKLRRYLIGSHRNK